MKKEWVLTKDSFDMLLDWLNTDRNRAGLRYEEIRVRLIKIFTCRGCPQAEELADETINRVVSKLHEIISNWEGDPSLYFYKVAQNIFLEWRRDAARLVDVPVEPSTSVLSAPDDSELEHTCLEQCLSACAERERTLVLEYYQEQGRAKINHRRRMAAELGIAVNALRIRAHRIRRELKKCVLGCLEAQPAS